MSSTTSTVPATTATAIPSQAWGGGASEVVISADGTYNFPAYLEANGTGTVVWVIDIVGLWKDLSDPSKLDVKVNSVTTPVHAE